MAGWQIFRPRMPPVVREDSVRRSLVLIDVPAWLQNPGQKTTLRDARQRLGFPLDNGSEVAACSAALGVRGRVEYGPNESPGRSGRGDVEKQIRPRRVGVIGLGAGSMVAYARKGDTLRFYEIKPQVLDLAKREFTFIDIAPVMASLAQEYGLAAVLVSDTPNSEGGADYRLSATDQILVTKNRRLLESAQIRDDGNMLVAQPNFRVWTDDYNSLWGVLK